MLQVKNLTVAFGESVVLSRMSFSLGLGESLGFVGESGSGKTITALALMGLLPPQAKVIEGEALLTLANGTVVSLLGKSRDNSRRIRGRELAMVFQEPMTSLNPSMRCGRQVEESISRHLGQKGSALKESCLSLFREMQLPDPQKAYSSYPHQLSGGQKQRVMIAMALAGNPRLLIADEPTTALDVTVQKEILALLRELQQKRNMSLLFISHDLGVISNVTQSLMVLRNGVLVESGSTTQLLRNPTQPYTQGLIACRPPIGSRPMPLPTIECFTNGAKQIEEEKVTQVPPEPAPPVGDPILQTRNLEVEYTVKQKLIGPDEMFRAVSSISFNLYKGETLGLVGESGCGKSTLGRSILNLIKPSGGEILYKGRPLDSLTKSEEKLFRREVQVIFQDPYSSLNPRHTIGATLIEPLGVHGICKGKQERKHRAMELLELVGLHPESYFRYPHEFSGGQRQRVAIARALTLNPELLICDEMVSALDVSVQAQILNLLNRLKREQNLTYIFISHDLSVVRYMSNRIMVMQHGQVVEMGDSDSILSDPQESYTRRLIDAIPTINS